ncbi:hypothetical protein D3C75_905610 [compost metagenome]
MGQLNFLYDSILNVATIRDSNISANRYSFFRILHVYLYNTNESILLQQRVGINGCDQRMAGKIDAGIQRIRFSSIILVN